MTDAFDVATTVGDRPDLFFGEIDVAASFVKLVKGQGKIAYVEGQDDPRDRRTEVSITIIPLPESGLNFPIQRDVIAESREWSGIVWASLRDLGIKNAREIKGKFAAVELVETGRTWNDRRTGEERKATTIKFHELYNNEIDCLAAYNEARGGSADDAQPTQTGASANGIDKNMAEQFLPPLVKQAAGDEQKLAELIANIPQVAAHFTVKSPEVQRLLKAA